MILRRSRLSAAAVLLFVAPLSSCLDSGTIPSDAPIASLIASAKSSLAQGNANDALEYYGLAISRDPQNYLTVFQRGATYLSLGRNGLASADFNKVLEIKPGFEGALVQRAKLKSRSADWEGAKKDYKEAGKQDAPDYKELAEAEGAAALAVSAEDTKDWENCVSHAGTAIMVASTSLTLRNLRARCRFERGEVQEGVNDLQHVLQISPGSTEPYLRISSMLFYSLGDTEKGLGQVSQCLRSDQDDKACKNLRKQEKRIEKGLKKLGQLREKHQYNTAAKLIVGDGEDRGLLEDVKEDVKEAKAAGMIHENSPNELQNSLIESACEFYNEMNNKKRAGPYCEEALQINPESLYGNLHKARRQIDNEEWEAAINTLNGIKEHHPGAQQIQKLLNSAQVGLKRSKTKDYYKVIGVAKDADDRTIKKAYRTLTKKWHPDKASTNGLSKEDAEKKMAGINEAYEVLSDPEKRAQFDRGDDPNNPEHQGNPFQGSPFGGQGGQQFFFQSGHGGGGQRFQFQGGGFPGGFPFGGM